MHEEWSQRWKTYGKLQNKVENVELFIWRSWLRPTLVKNAIQNLFPLREAHTKSNTKVPQFRVEYFECSDFRILWIQSWRNQSIWQYLNEVEKTIVIIELFIKFDINQYRKVCQDTSDTFVLRESLLVGMYFA